MSIDLTRDGFAATYSVVAFMVKVKLVEKRVKSTVGKVMVVNGMIQNSTAGMSLAMSNTAWPSRPIQVSGVEPLGVTVTADLCKRFDVVGVTSDCRTLEVVLNFPRGAEAIAAAVKDAHIGRHRLQTQTHSNSAGNACILLASLVTAVVGIVAC